VTVSDNVKCHKKQQLYSEILPILATKVKNEKGVSFGGFFTAEIFQ
jgi:hypothetical protein